MAGQSKYRSVAVNVDGIRFASKAEARRYGELKLLEKAGKIDSLELQPRFPLYVGETGTSLGVKIGEWRGDFQYWENTRHGAVQAVEDVKGFKTPLYRWKKKHVEAQYGITIREVRA